MVTNHNLVASLGGAVDTAVMVAAEPGAIFRCAERLDERVAASDFSAPETSAFHGWVPEKIVVPAAAGLAALLEPVCAAMLSTARVSVRAAEALVAG